MQALHNAHDLLNNPGLSARMTNLIGTPIEKGLTLLPNGWNDEIGNATKLVLTKAADAAIFTLECTRCGLKQTYRPTSDVIPIDLTCPRCKNSGLTYRSRLG